MIVPIRAFLHATEVCPRRRGAGQDRVWVSSSHDRIVIALADGAGGTAGGERAAAAVIDAVAAAAQVDDWAAVLTELELDPDRLGPGQTTAVVVTVTREGIRGASAGDSGAWVIRGERADQIDDLTHAQHRKPLIGDHSIAIPFHGGPLGEGTLLVASDGLLRFAPPEAIARVARGPDLTAAARELVELVRLPSGEVPDDISIVLCREAAPLNP